MLFSFFFLLIYRNFASLQDENSDYKPFSNNMSDSFKSKNYPDDDYYANKKSSGKKQDQNFYASSSSKTGSASGGAHYQQSRDFRQASEPRSQANNFEKGGYLTNERNNRDTRSVEANKPPSGRRNSNPKPPIFDTYRLQNIKALPPRLQKKQLMEIGLTMDDLNRFDEQQPSNQQSAGNSQQHWTNTMPMGGRANKNHRYDHHMNQNQGQRYNSNSSSANYHHGTNKHQQNYYQSDNFRSLTPPPRNRASDNSYENNKHQSYYRNDWKHSGNSSSSRYENKTPSSPPQQTKGEASSSSSVLTPPKFTANDSKFDWSEDVENASLSHDVNNFSPKSNVNSESSASRKKNQRRRNRR